MHGLDRARPRPHHPSTQLVPRHPIRTRSRPVANGHAHSRNSNLNPGKLPNLSLSRAPPNLLIRFRLGCPNRIRPVSLPIPARNSRTRQIHGEHHPTSVAPVGRRHSPSLLPPALPETESDRPRWPVLASQPQRCRGWNCSSSLPPTRRPRFHLKPHRAPKRGPASHRAPHSLTRSGSMSQLVCALRFLEL